jgi:hypothetical protein
MNREAERKRLVELIENFFEKEIGASFVKGFLDKFADNILDDGWMRPPVNVGQTVWLIKSLNWQKTEWGIKEGKISMIQQKADKSWKFRITENHSVQDYTVDKIGKTVFTSREEALKALEGSGEK